MAHGKPDTVDEWAPIFLFFSGSSDKKYTKEQVLEPSFALVGSYCKLCDFHFSGPGVAHMREHGRELTAWLGRRRKEAAAKSKLGLKTYRQEKGLEKQVIEPADEED